MKRRTWLLGVAASVLAAAGAWGGWHSALAPRAGAPVSECCPPDCCPDCCTGARPESASPAEVPAATPRAEKPAAKVTRCCSTDCCGN